MSNIKIHTKKDKLYIIEQVDEHTYLCECACGNQIALTEQEIESQTCSQACSYLRGEVCAADLFEEAGVDYVAQQKFADTDLTFDFYLPKHNIIIECDGAQHFRTQNNDWHSEFKLQETAERDRRKEDYCREHNIILFRIPFWDYDKLNIDYIKGLL